MKDEDEIVFSSRRCSIRTLMLIAVNLPVVLLAAVVLPFEYRQAIAERVRAKQLDLEEEARATHPALVQLRNQGHQATKRYLDSVCASMQDSQSPGHHLAIELDGVTLQADSHHRASSEILSAMRRAASTPSRRVRFGDGELVVGFFAEGGIKVFVAESLANIESAARNGVMRRLVGFLALALVAAAVVNVSLVQVISKPIERLAQTVRRIGDGELGARAGSFSTLELDCLALELNAMSEGLAKSAQNRDFQMSKAREVQQNLLPNGVSPDGFSIASLFEPAEDVGGDFYDLLRLPDDTWLVFVADVSGHGIPAAMSAALLKTLVAQAAEAASPARILSQVNQGFSAMSLDGDFATAIALRLYPGRGRLDYASAGHDPGWLISRHREAIELSSTGMPLGVLPEAEWDEASIELAGCDRVLLVTDGVCETSDREGQLFGRRRIATLLEANRGARSERVIDLLKQSLREHRGDAPQTDDVTAVVLDAAPRDHDVVAQRESRSPARAFGSSGFASGVGATER